MFSYANVIVNSNNILFKKIKNLNNGSMRRFGLYDNKLGWEWLYELVVIKLSKLNCQRIWNEVKNYIASYFPFKFESP